MMHVSYRYLNDLSWLAVSVAMSSLLATAFHIPDEDHPLEGAVPSSYYDNELEGYFKASLHALGCKILYLNNIF